MILTYNNNNKRVLLVVLLILISIKYKPTHVVNASNSSYQNTMEFNGTTIDYWPTTGWLNSTPEAQGMDSNKLEQMKYSIQKQNIAIDSVIIVKNGYIIFEDYFSYYTQNHLHRLYSVTKSFISALIGIAIQKGYINSIDQKIVEFFPDKSIANLDSRKKSITLEHALTMSTGLKWDEWTYPYTDSRNDAYKMDFSSDCVQYVLDREMINEPGEEFEYNSGVSHVLSAIIQRSTGKSTLDFAQEVLFNPLGIYKASWARDSQGVCFGGAGLSLCPRDMAKFGYLYLNNGIWDNTTVISKEWVETSTTSLISTYFSVNYGYQWWVFPSTEIFFASGFRGQNIMVIPRENMIVVFTASLNDLGFDPEYELLQNYILRAIVNSSAISYNGDSISLGYNIPYVIIVIIPIVIHIIRRKKNLRK
ncbi:MAG: serine hydrolase domain-containing protein [Candidatus Hodarchaeota archaeon]